MRKFSSWQFKMLITKHDSLKFIKTFSHTHTQRKKEREREENLIFSFQLTSSFTISTKYMATAGKVKTFFSIRQLKTVITVHPIHSQQSLLIPRKSRNKFSDGKYQLCSSQKNTLIAIHLFLKFIFTMYIFSTILLIQQIT